MAFFKNLSIRGKILSVLFLLVGLQIAVSLVGLHAFNLMNANLDRVSQVDVQKIRLTGEIGRCLSDIYHVEKNIILDDAGKDLSVQARRIRRLQEKMGERLSALKPLTDSEGLALIDKFERASGDFLFIDEQIQNLFLKWNSAPSPVHGASMEPVDIDVRGGQLWKKASSAYDHALSALTSLSEKVNQDIQATNESNDRNASGALGMMAAVSILSVVVALAVGLLVSYSISSGLGRMVSVSDAVAEGNFEAPVEVDRTDEIGRLASSMSRMQTALKNASEESKRRDWLKTGLTRFNDATRGEVDLSELSGNIIHEVSNWLGAQAGVIYLVERAEPPSLRLLNSYACEAQYLKGELELGEGLAGQAVKDRATILVEDVPEDYLTVTSTLGKAKPRMICIVPLLHSDLVKGVMELAFLRDLEEEGLDYLNQISPKAAVLLEAAQDREELAKALRKAERLTEELQIRQEELKASNEELEEQTQLLQQSEERLKEQQEELEASNEEMEEKNEALKRQKIELEKANDILKDTRLEIERKAAELARASKYKSEFLANMSHELRTPLNSMLLLSRLLAENGEGNLTKDQMESAGIIHKSGNELLSLINDILDLSKIEAGRMDINPLPIPIQDLADGVKVNFRPLFDEKGLNFEIRTQEGLPAEIVSDRMRLDQILRNLLSNAYKFTQEGEVVLEIRSPESEEMQSFPELEADSAIAFSVRDTGIGIPSDKRKEVFEAFRQVDRGTARRFGGTGLGLTISQELARLLEGRIQMESREGQGSVFTLVIPRRIEKATKDRTLRLGLKSREDPPSQSSGPLRMPVPLEEVPDDRDHLAKGDRVILIVEDDARFATLLAKQCRRKGLKCLVSASGEGGLDLAKRYKPAAIILDIRLPGIDGWAVLDALKGDPETRHIPVHIVSVEESSLEAFKKGAVGYVQKPVGKEELEEALNTLEAIFSREIKDLLVVEDDETVRTSIVKLIGDGDVKTTAVETGAEALRALEQKKYDCMILDLGLPDITGFELLKTLEKRKNVPFPPVIVYSGRDLAPEEAAELHRYAESIIIKDVKSEERLLDETSLFLHRVVEKMPEAKRRMITNFYDAEAMFKGKRVLVVDDDMRNVFALSKLLEERGVNVLRAEDGSRALEILEKEPEVDLVLMDIMMPVMDGYEAMRRIRAQENLRQLPIIALTAKAMKEDRSKCIEAGASDYLPKPVDMQRLFSMMRVWLYR